MEYDSKHEIKELQKIKKGWPDMPKNVREILDLWIKMYRGDTRALMKLSLMRGMISQEDYDALEFSDNKKDDVR